MKLSATLLWASALGCASGSTPSALRRASEPQPLFAERELGHFAPRPRAHSDGQHPRALVTTGVEEQARGLALAMLRATLRADELALQELLAERVVHTLEGSQRPREEWIERCVNDTRALAYGPALEPEMLVDTTSMSVRRAGQYHSSVPLPAGIEPSDLLVPLSPRSVSREGPRAMPCLSGVYVRPGPEPRIVGLAR